MNFISTAIHDEALRTVFLVFVGFLLAQLSSLFAERKERKKITAQALSEFLEVRHHFISREIAMEQIDNAAGSAIPEHEKSQLYLALTSILPKWEELHSRYEQSINTLSGIDPLLAFELRSKDFILPLVNSLNSLMSQDPKAASQMGPLLRRNVLRKIEPVMNKSILRLARKRSLFCWYRTKRFLNKRGAVSGEAQALFAELNNVLETAKSEVAKAATAPPRAV